MKERGLKMKSKKLLKGLMVMGVLVGLVAPKVAMADTGNAPDDSRNVRIKSMDDASVVSVDLEWGDLQYEYVYENGYGYWTSLPNENDSQTNSGYIKIANRSRFDIRSSLEFLPTYSGIGATYDESEMKEGVGSCVDATDKLIYSNAWSEDKIYGLYEYKTDPMSTVIYSDSNCKVQVADGAEYDSSKNYYYVKLDSTFIGAAVPDNSNVFNTLIPGVERRTSEEVVGSQFDSDKLATIVKIGIDLFGGDYSTVQEIYNTSKKVGTLSIWLYSGD